MGCKSTPFLIIPTWVQFSRREYSFICRIGIRPGPIDFHGSRVAKSELAWKSSVAIPYTMKSAKFVDYFLHVYCNLYGLVMEFVKSSTWVVKPVDTAPHYRGKFFGKNVMYLMANQCPIKVYQGHRERGWSRRFAWQFWAMCINL